MPSLERWKKFSQRDQLGHIGAELYRAASVKESDHALAQTMLERALELIDLTLEDEKWRENSLPLLKLRGEIALVYTGKKNDIARIYALL